MEGGKGAAAAGKVGRPKQDGKQRKLVTEAKEGGKRVSFRLECGKECEKRMVTLKEEIKKEMSEIIRSEIKGWEEEKGKVRELVKELEERIKGIERDMSRLEEWVRGEWAKSSEGEEGGDSDSVGNRSKSSVSCAYSGKRYGSERSLGEVSGGSRLSSREVEKIKRWVEDKEREERKCNIVIRGVRMPKEAEKDWKKGREWAEEYIRESIGVECKVISCRESGAVVVVRLGDENMKKEIMKNKCKLKGGRVFIENDLSWEERKTQGEINRWAKAQREKGIEVKIGIGRVRVKGSWRNWNEILKEKEEKENRGDEREDDRRDKGKEVIEEERIERKRRTGMDNDRKIGMRGGEEAGEEIDGRKGMEKNLE